MISVSSLNTWQTLPVQPSGPGLSFPEALATQSVPLPTGVLSRVPISS